jgi:hypothetical protein
MEESKTSRARVAFALLCGLAVCCSVMYITSDAEEVVLSVGSGQDIHQPRSIESTDVMKTATLITKTPDTLKKGKDGRQHLLSFLDKVERNIAKEVASRKADIAAIRQKMAKNMELNAAARKKMRTMLLAKMAANAKIAKDDLRRKMRWAQKTFAEAAATENKRNRENRARFRKTREIMRKNKAAGAHALATAVRNQQAALATLDQATNAKIKSTNAHIAANSAAIKANAEKARRDLDNEMDAFDKKMANVRAEAKAGRSKLAQQARDQDKQFREYANNKIREHVSEIAAEFKKVRATMAKDRADADAAIAGTASKMNAALAAQHALEDKRFIQTVNDIKAAKKEAADRVESFRTNFKADILKLKGVATRQTQQLNDHVTTLSGTVESNKAAQAKVNNAVNAELTRLVKLGHKRYDEHLKKDKELRDLMKKNKADTKKQMDDMATKFNAGIDKIQKRMKADRKHHEQALKKSTGALYKTLADNLEAQDKVNKKLTDQTRAVEMESAKALKEAKASFARRYGVLKNTVETNERKVNKKVLHLTGIVEANAIKSQEGRNQLKKLSAYNKDLVHTAIDNAIHQGEQRAVAIETKMKGINKKNRADLNNRISTEIHALRTQIHGQITDLTLETKEARAMMKREIMQAISEASKLAADNLKKSVAWAEGEFSKLHKNLLHEKTMSAEERRKLKESMDANKKTAEGLLDNAVAAQAAALLSFKNEMCNNVGSEDIKGCPEGTRKGKLNNRLSVQADIMIANAKQVRADMKAQTAQIEGSLQKAQEAAQAQLAATSKASVDRYNAVMKAVKDGVKKANDKANKKFADAQTKMGENSKHHDKALAAATQTLNDAIAKASALEDQRFSKTVKDITAARKAAADDIAEATKEYKMGIAAVRAQAKNAASAVGNAISVVSGMIREDKAAQLKINQEVDAELNRIEEKSNTMETTDKKARGVIRKIMDENKVIAAEQVKALGKHARNELKLLDSYQNKLLSGYKSDLTKATEEVYKKFAEDKQAQQEAMTGLEGKLTAAKARTAGALKSAKAEFASRTETLNNAIINNAEKFEKNLARVTGVVDNWKKNSKADRKLIREERALMETKLRTKIQRAIKLGEARMKEVQDEAMANIATEKKALLTTIAESVENMADNVFATVQGNRKNVADNYLSLKAYAAAAADKVQDYVQKGKGRNLSSIGDLLTTLAAFSKVRPKKAKGPGFGEKSIPNLFNGKKVFVSSSVTRINGLVNQYLSALTQVKNRWQMGLGKYLLNKLEIAMQNKGALEVDKIEGRSGNFVFINGHAVGLSSRLSDFERLAVSMRIYESTLASITKLNVNKFGRKAATKIKVGPPEWQGD